MNTIFKSSLLVIICALLLPINTMAQGRIHVKGTVTDDAGEALIGVTVKVKGGKALTATDAMGQYDVQLNGTTELMFTYVGMESQSRKVSKSGTIDVVLSSASALDEVVVVGYGQQKKVNLTGSVQSVSSSEIIRRSVSNGSSVLQGIVPGLTAIVSSGQPGADQASMQIRGLGSLNSSSAPLILIDGIEGDMNRIDLNAIESITVLKDAASASIYGSRASNGVILVTTKRGAEGKVKVTFNGYAGKNVPTTIPKQTTAIQYMEAVDQARANAYQDPLYTEALEVYRNGGVDQLNYYDTDWRNLVLNGSGVMQNYSLGVHGGNSFAKVYATAGYYNQEGLIKNNYFGRTTLRLNSDLTPTKWLKVGADISIRQANVKAPVLDSPSGIIGKAMTMTPIMSGINADGSYGYGINGTNPIAMIENGYTKSTAPEYIAKLSATINPIKEITLFGSYSWKRNDGETTAFAKPYDTYENGVFKGAFPTTGSSQSEQVTKQINKQYNLQATFEKEMGKHYLKVMGGFQAEEMKYKYLLAGRKNYYYDGYEDLINGDASTMSNSSARYEFAMLSYLYRVNYTFDRRYLLEVNGRFDGTSRFRKGNRWGFFPSFSGGWRISEEAFFEGARDAVSNLKLRASYGILGNQAISGYYPYTSGVGISNAYGYWFDEQLSTGVAQTAMANPDITWEKSHQFDVGIDITTLNGRLNITGDYYVRKITDMLQRFAVPLFVGMTAPWENAGSMRNNGWELSISWNDRIGDFNYYIKGNLSDVKNKVLDLYGNEYLSGGHITTEGQAYNSWYGYVADGYFQSQEEINESPVYGGNKNNVRPGYIKYKDISGPDGEPDGKIDSYDRTILGCPTPRYEFGLTLGADWKGIDFSVFFQGVGKRQVYYTGAGARALSGNYTIYEYQLDTWTEDNRNAKFPILLEDPNGSNPNNMLSSFWVKSGAYCRLKNIVLGYTLPSKLTQKAHISKVRIYATGQNLLTFHNNFYQGFDPENYSGASCYPLNKTYIVGLNVEF